MYIEPIGLFMFFFASLLFSISFIIIFNIIRSSRYQPRKTTRKPEREHDDPEWDIGAYSNAWWERD